MGKTGECAVVLGASMGGLFAARVLAEFYRSVTVVERDVLPDDAVNRRGVPQGRHAHALLARSSEILDELFPGFLNELVADGVKVWKDGDLSKVGISVGGHEFVQSGTLPDNLTTSLYFPSRAFLETNVLRRVRAIPNVTILDGHTVADLTSTPDHDRVTGVQLVDPRGDHAAVAADLVVDATGRGSRLPAFLEKLGYGRPPEDELIVRLAYTSQLLRIPPDAVPEYLTAIFPEPGRLKTWAFFCYEQDKWILTVGSMMGLQPPKDLADMLSFGADFAPPHQLAAVAAAEPIGETVHYRVPSNRWRRYDKMRRMPEGLIAFGDAICSFNPIYGQGMTVAAIEATILRDCLRSGDRHLPRRFVAATAKKLRVAWQTAVGSDLALPEVVGPRPLSMRVTNAYLDRVLRAAENDPLVAGQFLRVTGMVDPAAQLLRPSFVLRVARATARRRREAVPSTEVRRHEYSTPSTAA